jgi:hypothetical protein
LLVPIFMEIVMKVYVLTKREGQYEEETFEVVGVFLDKEKTQKYVNDEMNKPNLSDYMRSLETEFKKSLPKGPLPEFLVKKPKFDQARSKDKEYLLEHRQKMYEYTNLRNEFTYTVLDQAQQKIREKNEAAFRKFRTALNKRYDEFCESGKFRTDYHTYYRIEEFEIANYPFVLNNEKGD